MLKPEMKRGLHMSRVLKKLETGSDQFLGMIGFVGILVITANAFCRFVLRISMAWSDEFLRTIMAISLVPLLCFLKAAACVLKF